MPAIRGSKSNRKTRRRRRDLDQVHSDLCDSKHLSSYKDTKAAEDLPALGEFYCVECAKWFESAANKNRHIKGKPHKRRVRQLREEPYSQKEAEAAAGLTTDNGRPEAMAIDRSQVAEQDPTAALVSPRQASATDVKSMTEDDDAEEYHAFFSAY